MSARRPMYPPPPPPPKPLHGDVRGDRIFDSRVKAFVPFGRLAGGGGSSRHDRELRRLRRAGGWPTSVNIYAFRSTAIIVGAVPLALLSNSVGSRFEKARDLSRQSGAILPLAK